MPEVRMVSRTAVADRSAGGFFLRRVASPGAVAEKGAVEPLARRVLPPSNNKENVPPVWAATTALKRRSSLPEWYPRTPLRDITAVIKAVERKRSLRDATAWQQIQWTEESAQSMDVPQQTEQDVPSSTPPPPTNETVAAAAAVASAQDVANAASTCADTIQAEGMPKASDGDYSLQTPTRPGEPEALTDLMEKKLASSIEQIEKMVSGYTRRDPKAAQPSKNPAVQRRILMSMR